MERLVLFWCWAPVLWVRALFVLGSGSPCDGLGALGLWLSGTQCVGLRLPLCWAPWLPVLGSGALRCSETQALPLVKPQHYRYRCWFRHWYRCRFRLQTRPHRQPLSPPPQARLSVRMWNALIGCSPRTTRLHTPSHRVIVNTRSRLSIRFSDSRPFTM